MKREMPEAYNKIRLIQADGSLCLYIDDTKIKAIDGYRLEGVNERVSKLNITILTDEILTIPKSLENLRNNEVLCDFNQNGE